MLRLMRTASIDASLGRRKTRTKMGSDDGQTGPYFAQNLFRFFVEPDSARCHNHLLLYYEM